MKTIFFFAKLQKQTGSNGHPSAPCLLECILHSIKIGRGKHVGSLYQIVVEQQANDCANN